jgi:hypothetical protein
MVYAHSETTPLRTRYEALADKVCAAGGTAPVPITEEAVLAMQAWLQAHPKPAPEAMSPALEAACDSFVNATKRYDVVRASIIDSQQHLNRRGDKQAHALLNNLTNEMMQPPLPTSRMLDEAVTGRLPALWSMPEGWSCPRFATVQDARIAVSKVAERVLHLEGLEAGLQQACQFESMPAQHQARQLVFALASRIGVLESRLDAVEHENVELKKALSTTTTITKKGRAKYAR